MSWDPFLPQRLQIADLSCQAVNASVFIKEAMTWLHRPFSALLLSGGDLDCSRYCLACADPFAVYRAKADTLRIDSDSGTWTGRGDPLAALDRLMASFHPDFPLAVAPFCGGAVGYFAYELKNSIEALAQSSRDDLALPDLMVFFPGKILVYDRTEQSLHRIVLSVAGKAPPTILPGIEFKPEAFGCPLSVGALTSNFTRKDYMTAVERIRGYIGDGDVYQVNLTQRFSFALQGDPRLFWERLFQKNPAPFYAYIHAGDHRLLSTSMERFLFRAGEGIETRPIKGTRKRGATAKEDQVLRNALETSAKDDAELSMIVDLLRNDLGRICRPKSVCVPEHKRLEAYQNVYHLVSVVRGRLRQGITHGQILRATFPGGSITGCPKIRAMEIIDELEPHVRHVYTGSIGYLGVHDNMDLSIAIRTGIFSRGTCHLGVGGGVVYDSDPADEYEETLHKGRTFFDTVRSLEDSA